MASPLQIRGGTHLLYVAAKPTDRLDLYQRVLSSLSPKNSSLVALVDDLSIGCIEAMVGLAGVDDRRVDITLVDDVVADEALAWHSFCLGLDGIVARVVERAPGAEIILMIDLDGVFARCHGASEVMSVVHHLQGEHARKGRAVASVVSAEMLPRSLPRDFFDVHTALMFGSIDGHSGSGELDESAALLALASSEFRDRFLALARGNAEAAFSLVPRFLADYRRGFMLLDRRFTIGYCSPRAASLLGQSWDQLLHRPISVCTDGVDLVTLKHECEKLTPGHPSQSPFVISWRSAPGVYEPREVTVDAVTSGHETVGYIVSLSRVETARGPRASYQQLKEEKAAPRTNSVPADDDSLTADEAISGNLGGTQITRREHEVILLVLRQMSNRQISEKLNIAEVTVKKHLTSIYRKLRITSRAELLKSFARPRTES